MNTDTVEEFVDEESTVGTQPVEECCSTNTAIEKAKSRKRLIVVLVITLAAVALLVSIIVVATTKIPKETSQQQTPGHFIEQNETVPYEELVDEIMSKQKDNNETAVARKNTPDEP